MNDPQRRRLISILRAFGELSNPELCVFVSFEISSLAMAEMTEAAHLDAREDREPVTPEVTGPVNVPELPPSGDVDVATINAATDAFINGMVQAVGEEDDPRVKKTFQMWTVMGKLVTSNARLLSHHLEQMNEKLDGLTEWMKKDCESGQSCFEETRVTMAEFAKKFDVLSESIKFMSATSKTSAHDEAEVKKKMMLELANSREVLSHIRARGNTGKVDKKIGDLLWQIGELRSGGTQRDTADQNGGSLLSVLEVQLDNIASSLKEEFGKLSADLREAVERGVDPEKSLVAKKRKEMKTPDPAPEKRVKYFNPLTGQAFEGTAAEREAHMREWMAAYQGGTPVTPSGPSSVPPGSMPPGFGPLPTEFVPPPGSFPPGYMPPAYMHGGPSQGSV